MKTGTVLRHNTFLNVFQKPRTRLGVVSPIFYAVVVDEMGSHHVVLAGLELTDLPTFASRVLGLKACVITLAYCVL